ncbi:MAG: hypothetical protein ACKPB9_28225, partial [Dolichospermum sp.]
AVVPIVIRPLPILVLTILDDGVFICCLGVQLITNSRHKQNKDRNFVILPHRCINREHQVIMVKIFSISSQLLYHIKKFCLLQLEGKIQGKHNSHNSNYATPAIVTKRR